MQTPIETAGAGTTDVATSPLRGLATWSSWHYRVVATNGNSSKDVAVAFLTRPPRQSSSAASHLTAGTATLNRIVNPSARQRVVLPGPGTAYGSTTPHIAVTPSPDPFELDVDQAAPGYLAGTSHAITSTRRHVGALVDQIRAGCERTVAGALPHC